MAEKPTYEELAQRVQDLEQEKLESNMMKETEVRGEKWPAHKIESGMNSEIHIPEVELDSIINVDDIQSIMDEFCHLTNMVTAILDLKGKVIEATGWQDICTKFHRINPKTALNCTESDLFLAKNLKPGEYVSYKCKNGLWDVVTPLYVENKHLGNIYTGQFFYDDDHIDEDFFIKQAKACGFDKDSYLDALRRVPRYSRETISHLMNFLVKFTTYISKIGYFNIRLEKEIRERKQAEEEKSLLEAQLQQTQKMESIGTLAGGVAHEINNPINGIMNYAQLIVDRTDAESSLSEFAGEIIHETKRIATIVRNLLTFAREENQAHSSAILKDIIDNTMSLIQTVFKRDQISLEVDVSEDLPKIKCRSQQIQQVIMNLMTNARDALNEKYSGYDENKKIVISSSLFKKNGKRWIRTTVEDHGVGIEPDIKERIFDPFYTTKDRTVGTGLGLSISYSIVKDHHGELRVESEPGQYTKFHMDLPVDNGWNLEKDIKG
ncbi:MAG: PocR ligand-binding domain-containing protein [Deltaproteobacteria bacterium]|nr:PocR ligand-binding domain-containing protein [Deltaproteobacteria bacterium]